MRWRIEEQGRIVWSVADDARLPHEDHIEMSGQKVSTIIWYAVDADGHLALRRDVIWPMLRTTPGDVRGYLRRMYDDAVTPQLRVNGADLALAPLAKVTFDGALHFEHRPTPEGLVISRTLFPARTGTFIAEYWTVLNSGQSAVRVEIAPIDLQEATSGVYGDYVIETRLDPPPSGELQPGEHQCFGIVFAARKVAEPPLQPDIAAALGERQDFMSALSTSLILQTSDPVLNCAFSFAKLRAAESVFDTAMGLVHSPGGGNYYGGVWANDQAEYSGPFFPFLGDATANQAALNAYRIFAGVMTSEYKPVPSSFEVEGVPWYACGDRGDAAMIAYGAARFALAFGDLATARELWPAIEWCLEFCRRKTNAAGIVESDTDELENRFPSGTANLSTSTLAYGALLAAAALGRDLGHTDLAADYEQRATALKAAIESYFGATVEGFDTYRYYDGNDVLRAWICLPLTMGITERSEGTIAALFSPRLWSEDGLTTEAGGTVFWDRETLYALRGVFVAGQTETALHHLSRYTERRLLSEHVPYPVEAYPENNQQHLSAESALYCRVFTEGLFGITPTGLRTFTCTPRLPEDWPGAALRNIRAFGNTFDLEIERAGDGITARVKIEKDTVAEAHAASGQSLTFTLS